MVQYCRKCGSKLDDYSTFCDSCGNICDNLDFSGRTPVEIDRSLKVNERRHRRQKGYILRHCSADEIDRCK